MIDVFAHWREQEQQSTMQKMAAENVRLRREARTKTVVYWTCLLGVLAVGMMKLWGGI